MSTSENTTKDEGLIGNEKMEEAIAALQQEPGEELLAHALTVVRRRMREKGQVILAVDMPQEQSATPATPMQIQAVKTADGKAWWVAFTSFDEELRGSGSVMSTFMADMGQLFRSAVSVEDIQGVIVNPWNRTLMMDKNLIKITLGEGNY